METDRKWIVVRIDEKVAGVSTDYRILARISDMLACQESGKAGKKAVQETVYGEITATATEFDEVWKLRQTLTWDDLMLFGTDFQKKVWRKLWELTHPASQQTPGPDDNISEPRSTEHIPVQAQTENQKNRPDTSLICYSDFAELCQNRAGVRAVAHAIGLNPVSVIIPCHLVIPKEGIDKIIDIRKKAESTIFKGDDLCIGSILAGTSIDFGEYALGKGLKKELIIRELTENSI